MLVNLTDVDETERLPGISVDATRVGPFLFISGQTGADPLTGRFVSSAEDLSADDRARIEAHHYVAEIEWPVTAQTWAIYANLERILARHGGTLDNLVRTTTFFRDLGQFPAMERTRAILLKSVPPASAVMQIADRGLHPDVRLVIDAIAVLPAPGYPEVVKAPVAPSLKPGAHLSMVVRAGQLAWPSAQPGNHPVTGEAINRLTDLPGEAAWLISGNPHLDRREGRILAQVWRAYDNLRILLESAGSSLNDLVKETIWLRDFRYLPAIERVRRGLFPTAAQAPATSVIQMADLGSSDGKVVYIDVVGLIRQAGAWRKEPVLAPPGVRLPLSGPVAVRAGPLVFTSGVVGLGEDGQPIRSLSEVAGRGRSLQAGRPYREIAAVAQTEGAVRRLAQILDAAGSSLDRVAHLSVYASDFGELPEIERVLAVRLGNRPPAARTLAVQQVDAREDCRVQLEAIAFDAQQPG